MRLAILAALMQVTVLTVAVGIASPSPARTARRCALLRADVGGQPLTPAAAKGDRFLKKLLKFRARLHEDEFPEFKIAETAIAVMSADPRASTRALVVDLGEALNVQQDLLLKALPLVTPDEAARTGVYIRTGRPAPGTRNLCE